MRLLVWILLFCTLPLRAEMVSFDAYEPKQLADALQQEFPDLQITRKGSQLNVVGSKELLAKVEPRIKELNQLPQPMLLEWRVSDIPLQELRNSETAIPPQHGQWQRSIVAGQGLFLQSPHPQSMVLQRFIDDHWVTLMPLDAGFTLTARQLPSKEIEIQIQANMDALTHTPFAGKSAEELTIKSSGAPREWIEVGTLRAITTINAVGTPIETLQGRDDKYLWVKITPH